MDLSDLAPLATFVVATVALYVGLRTIRQRDLADRRDQWWKRFQWAADLTVNGDDHAQGLGLDVLDLLGTSSLAGAEEVELLEAAITAALDRRPELLDDGWVAGHPGGDAGAQDEGGGSRG